MRISMIIPAFNCEAYLQRAVDSLLATGYPNLEIVIVDDGSTDDTGKVANRLSRSHVGSVFAHAHLGRANRGVSATRNLGIERSTGVWIGFLDADDYVYPHRFTAALPQLMRFETDAVYTTTEMAFASQAERDAWPFMDSLFGIREPLHGIELFMALLRSRIWATSGILIRRSLLAKTGLFKEELPIAEDCHLWWRISLLGTIVPGDLSRPTGVYFRHGANCYRSGFETRLGMLDALLDFDRWSAEHGFKSTTGRLTLARIVGFSFESFAAARREAQIDLGWSILQRLVAAGPLRYGLHRPLLHCFASLCKHHLKNALGLSGI